MDETIKTLIERLKYKTKSNQAIWTKTSRDDEYKLELQKGAITTDNWNNDDTTFVDFTIINESGDTVERIFFIDAEEEYGNLLELHTLAKRSFYKVDDTLKGILNELNNEKVIGKERNSNDEPLF